MSTNDSSWHGVEIDYPDSAPPAVKFPHVGSAFHGTILAGWLQQATVCGTSEPRFSRRGQPIMQLVLLVIPDEQELDDSWHSVRRLYIDKRGLREGLKAALRQTGATRPQPGGRISVERGPADPTTSAHTFAIVYSSREKNAHIPANAKALVDRWQHLLPEKHCVRAAQPERTHGARLRPSPGQRPAAGASPGLLYLRSVSSRQGNAPAGRPGPSAIARSNEDPRTLRLRDANDHPAATDCPKQ